MQDKLQKGQYVEKRFRASADDIEVKQADDGRTHVRLPISSTALDRDGDEFSYEGLEDERDQINSGKVPAFLDHGRGSRGSYYGALGIVGTWDNAEIVTETFRDDDGNDEEEDVLYADYVPTKANEDAADIVALLEDDMPVGASVGFRIIDYEYEDEEGKFVFNSVDLLETSIVGIPSNPMTVNDGETADAVGAKALGSPDDPRPHVGRGEPASQQQPVALSLDGVVELRDEIAGLRGDLDTLATGETSSEVEESGAGDVEENGTDPADEADTETMTDDTDPDGGDDPATDSVDELRETVEEQTATVDDLVDSIESLTSTMEEERSAEESEAEEASSEDEEKSKDADETETETSDEDGVRLFVGDGADEDVQKEFETLQERADGGELDLAEAETQLFAEEESEDEAESDDSGADNGALI